MTPLSCRSDAKTAQEAKALICAVFPEFSEASVRFLDEGWDFQVFEVEVDWLFRFPKHEKSLAKLNIERRLLSDLEGWVSEEIPSYEYFNRPRDGQARAFGGYRKIPGVPGDVVSTVKVAGSARQLGEFLAKLHSFPVETARRSGVPEPDSLIRFYRSRAWEQLAGLEDLRIDRLRWGRYLEQGVSSSEIPSVVVHNDLWAEHILFDDISGQVTGIIDWSDALIADPAVDFSFLLASYGEAWLKETLSHYSGELDADVMPRIRYLAVCHAIHNITLGLKLNRPRWVEAGQKVLEKL